MDTLSCAWRQRSFWLQRVCVICDGGGTEVDGMMAEVMAYMHEFYFESAAMILTLITVGKMLEARSKGKTTDAIKGLMKLAPQTAVVVRDGKEKFPCR